MTSTCTYYLDDQIFTLHQGKEWDGEKYEAKTFGSRLFNYLETANGGPFRTTQAIDKIFRLLSHFVEDNFYSKAADICSSAWQGTAISHAPGAVKQYVKALSSLSSYNSLPGVTRRKITDLASQTAAFTSTIGYAVGPFLSIADKTKNIGKNVFSVAKIVTNINDCIELPTCIEDLNKAYSLANRAYQLNASEEFCIALDQNKNLQMLKTLKSTCSIAGLIMDVGFIYGGVAAMPVCLVSSAVVSLASTLFAISCNLYKDGMKYKEIEYFNSKYVVANTATANNKKSIEDISNHEEVLRKDLASVA